MTQSPAHDIALHLAGLGVGDMGATSGWSVNAFTEPARPDNAVTVYDTGGAPGHIDIDLDDRTIQVRVRAATYPEAFAKAESIREMLTRETAREIGGHRYLGIWLQSGPLAVGRDANDRHLLTTNYRVERQPVNGEGG